MNDQATPIPQESLDPFAAGHVIEKVLAEAKLTANISVIDVAKEFKKILQHPDKYSLTVGCAILYATQPLTEEDLKKRPRDENAVILIPCSLKSNCYRLQIVKEGQRMVDSPLTIQLSPFEEKWVEEKLRLKNNSHHWLYRIGCFFKLFRRLKIVPLLSAEGLHSELATSIIARAIKEYKLSTKQDLVLTKLYKSVLELEKEGYPTENVAFWDDLHPAEVIHKIIARIAEKGVLEKYRLDWAKSREFQPDLFEHHHDGLLDNHFNPLPANVPDAMTLSKHASPIQARQSMPVTIESAPKKQEENRPHTEYNPSFWSQGPKRKSLVASAVSHNDPLTNWDESGRLGRSL